MEDKKKMRAKLRWQGFLSGILFTMFFGYGVPHGMQYYKNWKAEQEVRQVMQEAQEAPKDKLNITRVMSKLLAFSSYLDQYYLYDYEEEGQNIEENIYKGMFTAIQEQDPYAAYYTADELQEFMENTTGEYVGIGVLVSQTVDPKQFVVVRVYEGSPAEEAGMLPGDLLYRVNGIDITQMDLDYIVTNMIKGTSGSSLDITVLRDGEEVTLTCERRAVETPTVASKMLEDNIGYVILAQFTKAGQNQFEDAVEQLLDEGMQKLIIDLRGNPGGDVEVATGLLDYILPDNLTQFTEGKEEFEQGKTLFVYMEDKNGKTNAWYAKDGKELSIPIVILVDENSASAAELFSGALRAYGKASLVGTTTFGKGIAQTTFPLSDGSAIEFTTENYYLPNGVSIHKKGLTPDVEEPLDEALKEQVSISMEEDNQLGRAIEVIKAQ